VTGPRSRTVEAMLSGQGGIKSADQIRLGLATQVVLGGLLTGVAGFVDAIGYIGLGGLFASFMSGASVSLGVGLGDGYWEPVQQGVMMIASFLGGVMLGTVLIGTTGAWVLPTVLFLEALLLAGGRTSGQFRMARLHLHPSGRGGDGRTEHSPAVRERVRLGVTFITGTLVSLGQVLGQSLLGRARPWRLGGHALLWGTLMAGAAAGTTLHGAFGPMALTVPAALVASLAMLSAVPVLARTQSHPARPRECRRHCDPEPDHPRVWPYY